MYCSLFACHILSRITHIYCYIFPFNKKDLTLYKDKDKDNFFNKSTWYKTDIEYNETFYMCVPFEICLFHNNML